MSGQHQDVSGGQVGSQGKKKKERVLSTVCNKDPLMDKMNPIG